MGPLVTLCFLTLSTILVQGNPHLPCNQTWIDINVEISKIDNVTSSNLTPLGTWFPDLLVDLCDLVGNTWDPSDQEPFPGYGCLTPGGCSNTRSLGFYICPAHSRDRKQIAKAEVLKLPTVMHQVVNLLGGSCGPPIIGELISVERGENMQEVGQGYCHQQGKKVNCGPCYDKKQSEYSAFPLATPGGHCNPLVIKVIPAGKKANWEAGKTWGLRLYRSRYNPWLIFTVKLVQKPLSKTALGPNQVLNLIKQPIQQTSTPKPSLTHLSTTSPSANTLLLKSTNLPTGTLKDPLLALLEQSYLVLNNSNPNITKILLGVMIQSHHIMKA